MTRALFLSAPDRPPPSDVKIYPIALQPRQPLMVDLPQIGTVPVTLTKPHGPLAWEAEDSNGAKHPINIRWIYPSHQLEGITSPEKSC